MIKPFELVGQGVRLEPLLAEHASELAAAAAEDRSSYAYTRVPEGLQGAQRYIESALADQAAGRALPWAVRQHSNQRVVGTTRFLDMDVLTWPPPWPPGVGRGPEPTGDQPPSVLEIGSTWYARSAQRTGLNTEVKWLQLVHAFDVWRVLRVSFKTDARNRASREAIQRLGAQPEGIRRAHTLASDGSVRDSAYFSIVQAEWPATKRGLQLRLARSASSPSR